MKYSGESRCWSDRFKYRSEVPAYEVQEEASAAQSICMVGDGISAGIVHPNLLVSRGCPRCFTRWDDPRACESMSFVGSCARGVDQQGSGSVQLCIWTSRVNTYGDRENGRIENNMMMSVSSVATCVHDRRSLIVRFF